MKFLHWLLLLVFLSLLLSGRAQACALGKMSEEMLNLAVENTKQEARVALASEAVQAAVSDDLKTEQARSLLHDTLIPQALSVAGSDAAKLKSELAARIPGVCTMLGLKMPPVGGGSVGGSKTEEVANNTACSAETPAKCDEAEVYAYLHRMTQWSRFQVTAAARNSDETSESGSSKKKPAAASAQATTATTAGSAENKPNEEGTSGNAAPTSFPPAFPADLETTSGISSTQVAAVRDHCKSLALTSDATQGALEAMELCVGAAEALVGPWIKSWEAAGANDPNKSRADILKDDLSVLQTRYGEMIGQGGVYGGVRYTLNPDGGFDAGYEILGSFKGPAFDHNSVPDIFCLSTFSWCRLYTDLSYVNSNIDSSDSEVTEAELITSKTFDPLEATDGIARVNLGYRANFSDAVGLDLSMGVTAPFDGGDDDNEARPRGMLGVHHEDIYRNIEGGLLGFHKYTVGVAYDSFWRVNRNVEDAEGNLLSSDKERNYWRFVLDGTYILPTQPIGNLRLAARVYVDTPLNGRGSSEVVFSLLLFKDINEWLTSRIPAN